MVIICDEADETLDAKCTHPLELNVLGMYADLKCVQEDQNYVRWPGKSFERCGCRITFHDVNINLGRITGNPKKN
jgi:hypothetical protein